MMMNNHGKKKLEVLSEGWWNSVEKISASQIGGYYWKVWAYIPYLAVAAIDEFDGDTEDYKKAEFRRIKAKLGRNTTAKDALERLSATTPLLVVDRYSTVLGKLISKCSFGNYKRYACLNPYQAFLRDIISGCIDDFEAQGYTLHAIVADHKLITKDYLRELSFNMKNYKRQGFIDAESK